MTDTDELYGRCYHLRGDGDTAAAAAIQARLREYGLCSYFNWDPRPPRWRFFYETNLTHLQIERVLGAYLERFAVEIRE